VKKIEVVAAIITNEKNEFYCARRKDEGEIAKKWEFPGGKIEAGETPEEALKREIKEELSADIVVHDHVITVKHQYNSFHLTMHAYYAIVVNGNLKLSEHIAEKWLDKESLDTLDWAEADVPIIEALKAT
jgi:8-oxo-dGTP diphosphatase